MSQTSGDSTLLRVLAKRGKDYLLMLSSKDGLFLAWQERTHPLCTRGTCHVCLAEALARVLYLLRSIVLVIFIVNDERVVLGRARCCVRVLRIVVDTR